MLEHVLTLLLQADPPSDDEVFSDWYPGLFLVIIVVVAWTIWRRGRKKNSAGRES